MNRCWNIVNSNHRNKFLWNLKHNSNIFAQEKAFENVAREMVAILSQPQRVNKCLFKPASYHNSKWIPSNIFFYHYICQNRRPIVKESRELQYIFVMEIIILCTRLNIMQLVIKKGLIMILNIISKPMTPYVSCMHSLKQALNEDLYQCSMSNNLTPEIFINSLWSIDAIWRHRSGSMLAHVMARCLTAPSHYMIQCWLVIKATLRHSPGSNFTSAHKLDL